MKEDKLNKLEITKSIHSFYQNIDIFDMLQSTNDKLKSDALSLDEGAIIISDMQSAGKGKNGKKFFCKPGKGIYLSLLLKPDMTVNKMLMVVAIAAVSLVEAIEGIYKIPPKLNGLMTFTLITKKSQEYCVNQH